MKPANLCLSMGLILAACALSVASASAADRVKPENEGWIPLFNGKNLDGWYSYLGSTGKNKDPKGVFKVENGMIHLEDVDMSDGKPDEGYLGTNEEYSNVRIHVEYKWGVKRSSEVKRNSGLLYLAVGPDAIYPTSLECQIQETDTGDLFIINGASVTAFFLAPTLPMYDDDMRTGTPVRTLPGQDIRVLKAGDFENRDGWNSVDVIIQEDRTTQLVNGRIVNRAINIQQPDPRNPSRTIPLKSGRILLEAEGAEIWFRDVRIKPLEPLEKPLAGNGP